MSSLNTEERPMLNKKLLELPEELEFSYDLASVEMDTSPKRLRYISSLMLEDAITKDLFDLFWKQMRDNESVIVAVNDTTDLYEVGDDMVIVLLHETQVGRYIVFDEQDAKKVEHFIFTADRR